MKAEGEWLESLKSGDEVYVSRPYGQAPAPGVVSRVTEKMVMVKFPWANPTYERRYWKKDGWSVGHDSYSGNFLIQPSDEVREKVEIENLKLTARQLRDHLSIPGTIAELRTFIEAIEPLVKDAAALKAPDSTAKPRPE